MYILHLALKKGKDWVAYTWGVMMGCSSPLLRRRARRWVNHLQACDARPVRRQINGYLSSRNKPLPHDRLYKLYRIILYKLRRQKFKWSINCNIRQWCIANFAHVTSCPKGSSYNFDTRRCLGQDVTNTTLQDHDADAAVVASRRRWVHSMKMWRHPRNRKHMT